MIVDDSLTVRTIFKRMCESAPGLHVAASASNAEKAISMLQNSEETGRIDVILLDLEMPGMGGLEALPLILEAAEAVQVLVISSLTEDGAEATVKALSTGAADTMLKPRPGGFNDEYRSQLLSKISALGKSANGVDGGSDGASNSSASPLQPVGLASFRPKVVAIGASTGGIHALNIILRELTADFTLPILVTQHLPASFIPVFARQIEMASDRPAVIAEDGTPVRPGEIVIATGHAHMDIRQEHGQLICRTLSAPARSGCMPSVDPMLTSLSEACDGKVLAIILSGMGRDGAEGAGELVENGGMVFAQDAETSAVWGMPGAVSKAGLTSLVAKPEQLAKAMMAQANGIRLR